MKTSRTLIPALTLTALMSSLTACGGDSAPSISVSKAVTSPTEASKACETLFGKNGTDLAKWSALGQGDTSHLSMTSDIPQDKDHITCTVHLNGSSETKDTRIASVYNSADALNRGSSDAAGYDDETRTHVSATNTTDSTGILANMLPPQAKEDVQHKINDLAKSVKK